MTRRLHELTSGVDHIGTGSIGGNVYQSRQVNVATQGESASDAAIERLGDALELCLRQRPVPTIYHIADAPLPECTKQVQLDLIAKLTPEIGRDAAEKLAGCKLKTNETKT